MQWELLFLHKSPASLRMGTADAVAVIPGWESSTAGRRVFKCKLLQQAVVGAVQWTMPQTSIFKIMAQFANTAPWHRAKFSRTMTPAKITP